MKKKIGQILLATGSVTAAQLKEALMEQVDSYKVLGEILVEKGILEERQVTEALGKQWDLPVVDVGEYFAESLALNLSKVLPRNLMEQHRVVPLTLQDGGASLLVAIADPLDLAVGEELRAATRLKIKFALATERDIYSVLALVGKSDYPDLPRPTDRVAEQPVFLESRSVGKTHIPEVFSAPASASAAANAGVSVEPEERESGEEEVFKESCVIPSLLGEILVRGGLIDEKQLAQALQRQSQTRGRLGEILVAGGFITEMKLAEALSTQLRLPLLILTRYHPMPEAVKSIPRGVAERLRLIPLSIVEKDLLLVAMADPLDLLAQDEVRIITGRDLKLGVTTPTEIRNNLDRLYNLQSSLESAAVEVQNVTSRPEHFAEAEANDAPVIQMVSNILNQAVRESASDVHIEPCKHNARVRYRVDGVLYTAFEYPSSLHPAVSARVKIMASMDIAERRKPQDGRVLIKTAGRSIDLRVNAVPSTRGEKIVLRILDQENSPVGLERLELEPDDLEKIKFFCKSPWGILLVTGPTGSGKSTTLYSMLERMNQPGVNIVTVEDPVEFTLDGICQIHVNEKAGLTFDAALRSILRQDPDKIMVGEIRDLQTAQIAIRAALTGHFVLSTLHTNDAPSALTRMVEMGVPPFLVAAALTGVAAQRLVRRLCPYCRKEYVLDANTCETLKIPRGSRAWKAVGCNECRQGYKGRKGIFEIMVMDDDLRKMILEGAKDLQLRSAAIEKGMKTLRRAAVNSALAGVTSMEEVFATVL